MTIPASQFTPDTMKNGIGFDASNYGYAVVEKSDMVFIPDLDTAMIDPYCEIPTLSITGNAMVIDYPENRPLDQYPRNIVLAVEQYMKECDIADTMLILPEFEFHMFDNVGWSVRPNSIGRMWMQSRHTGTAICRARAWWLLIRKIITLPNPLTVPMSAVPRCAWSLRRWVSKLSIIIRR